MTVGAARKRPIFAAASPLINQTNPPTPPAAAEPRDERADEQPHARHGKDEPVVDDPGSPIYVERTRLLHMGEVALDLFTAERGPAASGTFRCLNLYSLEYFFIFFGMQIKRIVKPCRISQARRFPNVKPGCPMSAGFSERA